MKATIRSIQPPERRALSVMHKSATAQNKLAVPTNEGTHIIDLDAIQYCQANGNYCLIHGTWRSPLLVSKTLGKVNAALPEQRFIRIHQSFVVNTDCITLYTNTSIYLDQDTELPVSRNYRGLVKQAMSQMAITIQ